MTWYNAILFVLILIVFLLLVWYIISSLLKSDDHPVSWKYAKKSGEISKKLSRLEKSYGDKGRFFTFWLQIKRINSMGIEGDIAELGVYKGDSAVLLRQMDPNREMHLFDTFEGFKEKDLEGEEGKAATYTTKNFADTSLEFVIDVMEKAENVHFYKGEFNENSKLIEDRNFALVNIDADLYKPTKAGLDFFYQRLSAGGAIIIHDHNPDWPGVMRAVNEFSSGIPEQFVCLPDKDGSVIFIKNRIPS